MVLITCALFGNKTMVMTLAPHPKKDRFGWGFVIDS